MGLEMDIEKLDCRGMACPNPVLQTKELIENKNPGRLSILVDNPAARENVSRFLGRCGFTVNVSEEGGIFEVAGSRSDAEPCRVFEEEVRSPGSRKILVLLGTESLGRGDEELGGKLVANFLMTLKEMGQELWKLVLVNGGVKLTVDGAAPLPALQELEKSGVEVLVCGTCLGHFGLLEKKKVGETTNMLDIVTSMQLADKVISLT